MPTVSDLFYLSRLEVEVSSDLRDIYQSISISGRGRGQRRVREVQNWRVERELRRGGFGKVYLEKCVDGSQKGEVRAVKELRKTGKINYYRELEAATLFSHPKYEEHFVQSFGWYETETELYLTMEYLPHGDLQRRIGTPMMESEGSLIMSQILQSLEFMHERDFTHRDLKPANVLVCSPGPHWWVKLADFGISKRAEQGVTNLHTQVYTPGYAAPEVFFMHLLGDDEDEDSVTAAYTNAVDVWSAGMIICALLTGEILFEEARLLRRYYNGKISLPLQQFHALHITDAAITLVTAMLSLNPTARPTSRSALEYVWLRDSDNGDTAGNGTLIAGPSTNEDLFTIPPSSYAIPEASARWTTLDKELEPLTVTVEKPNLAARNGSSIHQLQGLDNRSTTDAQDKATWQSNKTIPRERLQEAAQESPQGTHPKASKEEQQNSLQEPPLEMPQEAPQQVPHEPAPEATHEATRKVLRQSLKKATRDGLIQSLQETIRKALHKFPLGVTREAPQQPSDEAPEEPPHESPHESSHESPRQATKAAPQQNPLEPPEDPPQGPFPKPSQQALQDMPQGSPTQVLQEIPKRAPQMVPPQALSQTSRKGSPRPPVQTPHQVTRKPLPLATLQERLESPPQARHIAIKDRSYTSLRSNHLQPLSFLRLSSHTGPITALAFSPKDGCLFSASEDGTLRCWNLGKGTARMRIILEDQKDIKDMLMSPDGKEMVSTSASGRVLLWDYTSDGRFGSTPVILSASSKYNTLPPDATLPPAAYASNGAFLAWADWKGSMNIIDRLQWKNFPQNDAHKVTAKMFAISADSNCLVFGSENIMSDQLGIRGLDRLSLPFVANTSTSRLVRLVAASVGGMVAAAWTDNWVKIYSVYNLSTAKASFGYGCAVTDIAFSPCGLILAAAFSNKHIRLENVHLRCTKATVVHDGPIETLRYSPDGRFLAAAGKHSVTVWSIDRNGAPLENEGQRIWSKDSDSIWIIRDGKADMLSPSCLAFSPDSKQLAWTCSHEIRLALLPADSESSRKYRTTSRLRGSYVT